MGEYHNFCQFCIGTHSQRAQFGDIEISEGDMCELTHRAIRENEIKSGCEDYYDQSGTAYFIDVYSDIEYIDKQGNITLSDKEITRIIRLKYQPDSCEAWREVYMEALNLIGKKLSLPINNQGKWVSSNIFRCKAPRYYNGDYKDGIRAMKIVFTSSIYPHREKEFENRTIPGHIPKYLQGGTA